jgi:hypothetical protein
MHLGAAGLFVNKYVLSVLGFRYPAIFQVTIAGLNSCHSERF